VNPVSEPRFGIHEGPFYGSDKWKIIYKYNLDTLRYYTKGIDLWTDNIQGAYLFKQEEDASNIIYNRLLLGEFEVKNGLYRLFPASASLYPSIIKSGEFYLKELRFSYDGIRALRTIFSETMYTVVNIWSSAWQDAKLYQSPQLAYLDMELLCLQYVKGKKILERNKEFDIRTFKYDFSKGYD
jgi:hypothetical protein